MPTKLILVFLCSIQLSACSSTEVHDASTDMLDSAITDTSDSTDAAYATDAGSSTDASQSDAITVDGAVCEQLECGGPCAMDISEACCTASGWIYMAEDDTCCPNCGQ